MKVRGPLGPLLAESFVVIASILVAFGIDAWWDQRKAVSLEHELLVSLEGGFEQNVRLAEEVIREAKRQQALIGRFVAMSPAEAAQIPSDSVYTVLRALWRPNYIRPRPGDPLVGAGVNSAALMATLGAGQLSLISDNRLLVALGNWQGVAEELVRRTAEVIGTEREVMASLAHYRELQVALAGFDSSGELRAFTSNVPVLPGSVARRAREDNELMAQVARKGFFSRAEQDFLEQLMARADSVLVLIRADLRR